MSETDPDQAEDSRRIAELEAENKRLRARILQLDQLVHTLRFTVDAMPDFVSYVGADLYYRLCNRRYEDIVRGNSDSLVGRHVADVLGRDALKAIQPHIDRVLSGEPVCYQASMDYRFGEGQFVEVDYLPDVNDAGKVSGFAVLVRNVTKQKQAEEALLAQRDLLATLINSVPDVVVLKDGEGRWLLANNAAIGLFGLHPEGYLDRLESDLLDSEQSRFFRDGVDDQDVWQSGALVQTEVCQNRMGGRAGHYNLVKVPLFNDDGSRRYLIVVGRDVTELQQAALAKSEFLANVSHEIRTPMNAILGYSRLARQMGDPDKLRDFLDRIALSSDLLLRLINDVLDYSKIDAGKLVVEKIPFNLRELVEESVWLMAEQADAKGLELILHCAGDVPMHLIGDPLHLRQALINLLSNAIKFTNRGSVGLTVDSLGEDDGRAVLRFRVTDTGIGIPAEKIGELFEPFTQADSSHTRRYGGTGLGLAITRQLVRLMGGELSLDSRPAEGSEFRIRLPLERDPEAGEDDFPLKADMTGRRVLLVEDNDQARAAVKELMERISLRVTAVGSGEEAISAVTGAAQAPFDLLVLDWQMPDVNGDELLGVIRLDGSYAETPVLMMINTRGRETMQQAGGELPVTLLDKPVTLSSLLRSLCMLYGHDCGRSRELERDWPPNGRVLERVSGSSVLLVEDISINQQVMQEYLERCRVSVMVAENGREALEQVRSHTFDLVLMDVQMPEMDGFQATRAIRADGRFDDLPIVALTAHAMEGDREACLAAGMNDFLSKPVEPEALLQVLLRWIESGQPDRDFMEDTAMDDKEDGSGLPEALPGIDLENAMRKLSGDAGILRQLLVRFHQEYEPITDEVLRLLDSGDLTGARELLHKLKGASGVLDATRVYRSAHALGEVLREGRVESAMVSELRGAMDEVMDSLAVLR